MSHNIMDISDDTFETEVMNATVPVLVDFWAEWCGPCKMLTPILEEIADAYAGKLKIVKLNVDHNTTIPTKYGIRGIPTLLLFKEGNLEATQVGALSRAQLTKFLDSYL